MEKKSSSNNVGIKAYAALGFVLVIFSGVMPAISELNPNLDWLKAFDFITLCGKFGNMGTLEDGVGTLASNFQGIGGTGPRNAFLIGLGLIPGIMLVMGIIDVVESMGALDAAGKLLSPVLRPVMGVSGECAVSVVSSLQSTDAGPLTASSMKNRGIINERERMILTAFQYSGAGCCCNYFILGGVCIMYFEIPVIIPLLVIILSKYAGSQLMRFLLVRVIKLDENQSKEA